MPEQVLARRRRAEASCRSRGRAGRRSATSRRARRPRSRAGAPSGGSTESRQAAPARSNTLRAGHRHDANAPAALARARARPRPRARPPSRSRSGCSRRVAAHSTRRSRRARSAASCAGVARLCGSACRVSARHRRRLAAPDRGAPGDPGLRRVAGPPDFHARDQPQRREMLDRLVRRPVLAEADRVVRQHEDAARPR